MAIGEWVVDASDDDMGAGGQGPGLVRGEGAWGIGLGFQGPSGDVHGVGGGVEEFYPFAVSIRCRLRVHH